MQQELGSLTEQVKVQATAAEDSLDKVGSSYGTLSDSSCCTLESFKDLDNKLVLPGEERAA